MHNNNIEIQELVYIFIREWLWMYFRVCTVYTEGDKWYKYSTITTARQRSTSTDADYI